MSGVPFRVMVEGSSREVHPILREEVHGIAREAIRNAFRHAKAKVIEVEIAYRDNLRVRIRDDVQRPTLRRDPASGEYRL